MKKASENLPYLEDFLKVIPPHGPERSYKVVRVAWEDAKGLSDSWSPICRTLTDGAVECIISSVGILLADTKKYVVLAMSVNGEMGDYVLKIPRSNIRKFKVLETITA